ncbi:MAG: iron-containing alcohol dehydrogenase [Caulobacteraceae bacterium]
MKIGTESPEGGPAVIYGHPVEVAAEDLAHQNGCMRVLITTTRSLAAGPAADLAEALGDLCVGVFSDIPAHSPRTSVIAGAQAARAAKADLLLALGGGSVIDATKAMLLAIWAKLETPEALDPYRAGRKGDREMRYALHPSIRMAAAPTTLSAAEFTTLAGITDTDGGGGKEGFAHADFAPIGIILDPDLTRTAPPDLWFSTGMKAIDHAVEQLCSNERSRLYDAVAEEGLSLLVRGLRATKANPEDLQARQDCQFGMWRAMASARSGRGMGASHAIGHTLGGNYGVPHGVTSCVILPAVLAWNAAVGTERQEVVSRVIGLKGRASEAVAGLVRELGLPSSLKAVGVTRPDFQAIAEHTMHDAGVRTNPRPISSPADIVEILELAAG